MILRLTPLSIPLPKWARGRSPSSTRLLPFSYPSRGTPGDFQEGASLPCLGKGRAQLVAALILAADRGMAGGTTMLGKRTRSSRRGIRVRVADGVYPYAKARWTRTPRCGAEQCSCLIGVWANTKKARRTGPAFQETGCAGEAHKAAAPPENSHRPQATWASRIAPPISRSANPAPREKTGGAPDSGRPISRGLFPGTRQPGVVGVPP